MPDSPLPNDPMWPRAGRWIRDAASSDPAAADLAILGVPASLTSITPTGAHATPVAVRAALLRYSTYSASHRVDVAALEAVDFGDVEAPDGPKGEARVREAVGRIAASGRPLLVALGGDNSITHSVMRGLAGEELAEWGLVTIDAHHDVRDGETNGSPVRRLVEAGLPGEHIVQIGIADFSNSVAYAQRVREYGITVVERTQLRERPLGEVVAYALGRAGEGGRRVFVDIDVDVCDRAEVPGCPASAPGGINADELRQIAFLVASDSRVRGIDITEVDATRDAADQRTIRLVALLVLEIAAGLCVRLGVGSRTL